MVTAMKDSAVDGGYESRTLPVADSNSAAPAAPSTDMESPMAPSPTAESQSDIMGPQPAFLDPYLAVRDMLWLLPGINDLVRNAVERIPRICAYNSVYFLKVVLDLQSTYLSLQPLPPDDRILEKQYVVKIADLMATRIARKGTELGSLSRELQLRTLTSALTLLHHHNVTNLDNDTYARLLNCVLDPDSEFEYRYHHFEPGSFMCEGDIEYLVRYACDLIRRMPPSPEDSEILQPFGPSAIHFLFATGLVDPLDAGDNNKMERIFNRLKEPHSIWYKDLRYFLDGVAHTHALCLRGVKLKDMPLNAQATAEQVAKAVADRAEYELRSLTSNRHSVLFDMIQNGSAVPPSNPLAGREAQLFFCALLDLLNMLLSAFPNSQVIVGRVKELALTLIAESSDRKFRFKAFELILSTTLGFSAEDYLRTLDSLDEFIVNLGETGGTFGPQAEPDSEETAQWVEELKEEKEQAARRFEKKMGLYAGAKESLERRLRERTERRLGKESMDDLMSPRTDFDDSTAQNGSSLAVNANAPPIPSQNLVHSSSLPALDTQKTDTTPSIQIGNEADFLEPQLKRLMTEPDLQLFSPTDYDSKPKIDKSSLYVAEPDGTEDTRPLSFEKGEDVLQIGSRGDDDYSNELKHLEQQLGTDFGGHLDLDDPEADTDPEENTEPVSNAIDEKIPITPDRYTSSPALLGGGYEIVRNPEIIDEKMVVTIEDAQKASSLNAGNCDNSSRRPSHISIRLPIQGDKHEEEDFLPIQSPDDPSPGLNSPWGSFFRGKKSPKGPPALTKKATGSALSKQCSSSDLKPELGTAEDDLKRQHTIKVYLEQRGQLTSEHRRTESVEELNRRKQEGMDADLRRAASPSGSSNRTPRIGDDAKSRAMSPFGQLTSKGTPNHETHEFEDYISLTSTSPSRFPGSVNLLRAHAGTPEAVDRLNNLHQKRSSSSFGSISTAELYINKPLPPVQLPPVESDDDDLDDRLLDEALQDLQLQELPAEIVASRRRSSLLAEEAPILVDDLPQPQPLRSRIVREMEYERREFLKRHQRDAGLGIDEDHPLARAISPGDRPDDAPKPEYEKVIATHLFKLNVKESFTNFIASDCRHVVFMQKQSFQVFAVPMPKGSTSSRSKCSYKLGSKENYKKGKCPWTYTGGYASSRYIAAITKDRLQVHDMQKSCEIIFEDTSDKWEYTCVAISADKLVVGLKAPLHSPTENLGAIRIYKMSTVEFAGPRWVKHRDIRMPIGPLKEQDAPHYLSLTRDGRHVTCCTPVHGYFFSWDLEYLNEKGEPTLVSNGKLAYTQGPKAEQLTSAILSPDKKHIFCSTTCIGPYESPWAGSFTEPTYFKGTPRHVPIRQVGLKIHSATMSQDGGALAFLSKHGAVHITPTVVVHDDDAGGVDILQALPAYQASEKLQSALTPDGSGKLMFTPTGDRLVGVDLKGKVLVVTFSCPGPSTGNSRFG